MTSSTCVGNARKILDPVLGPGFGKRCSRKAREELQAIERGRYGNQPLPEPDVRLICIGKCLELYSAHYGKVLDHENRPLPASQSAPGHLSNCRSVGNQGPAFTVRAGSRGRPFLCVAQSSRSN